MYSSDVLTVNSPVGLVWRQAAFCDNAVNGAIDLIAGVSLSLLQCRTMAASFRPTP